MKSNEPLSRPGLWSIVGAGFAVVVASIIAFCCTCYPLGHDAFLVGIGVNRTAEEIELSNQHLNFAFRTGFVAAVLVGIVVCWLFWRSWRKL